MMILAQDLALTVEVGIAASSEISNQRSFIESCQTEQWLAEP
jgi:hypothetical protein